MLYSLLETRGCPRLVLSRAEIKVVVGGENPPTPPLLAMIIPLPADPS